MVCGLNRNSENARWRRPLLMLLIRWPIDVNTSRKTGLSGTFFFGAWAERVVVFVNDDANFFHKANLFVIVAFRCRELDVFNRRRLYSLFPDTYGGR